ncbi:LysR family transcriptional regulator [Paenibacillus sp. P26]|nr:LysR family transcriptional regulator [Paenibacillus sp. P26]UUZ94294.1 LysR family transcriptional regulator [Paenibacillus sp. P25]
MELSDLKVFVAVAEEGGVTRAAQRLDYVQSNVTARIRNLEAEIGVSLFHRHPKGVTLTEKGTDFREYALTILNLAEEAVKAVRETDEPSGSLAIGVVETVTCGNFMNALSDYQTRYPGVTLSLSTGTSPELLAKLANRQLDGAFVTGEFDSSKFISDYEIQDHVHLITKKNDGASPSLSHRTWAVFPKGRPFRAITEEWLHSVGLTPGNVIEISTLETLLSCVRSGLAFTLLPISVVGSDPLLSDHPVPDQFSYTKTNLIRRKDRFNSKTLAAFVERVKANGV